MRAAAIWLGLLAACNVPLETFHRPDGGGGGDAGGSSDGPTTDAPPRMIAQQTYVKASNTNPVDGFGYPVAVSADGSTMAVAAAGEDSSAIGINGDQTNRNASGAGAVYVFIRIGPTWTQQAYIKASNTAEDDNFGISLALSADGSTLAVGANGEDSAATGVGGNQADNTAFLSGAVYVFARSGTTWSQQAYLKASNTETRDQFGSYLALSGDGATLAVDAIGEDSAATGAGGDQTSNGATDSGAVYVFTRIGTTWSQQAYLKASNAEANDFLGQVALSGDGATLAVGAVGEASAATGIDGNQADNSLHQAGAVYVFARSGTAWNQQAYVKPSTTVADAQFGFPVALSSDGSTLAAGAAGTGPGAVHVFTRSGTTWSEHSHVLASNAAPGDKFGYAVAISGDGQTLVVGAPNEASAATGIDGNQTDNSALDAGAVYVFMRAGAGWNQLAYVKASNAEAADFLGDSVSVSRDGSIIAIGAPGEDSAATGVGGNEASNADVNSGAVYVFHAF